MAVIRVPAEDEQGRLAWPEKFSRKELDRMFDSLGDLRYAQQMLIEPLSLSGAELDINWLKLYDYQKLVDDEILSEDKVEYFWGVDPSISGKGDYLVICVVAKSSAPGYERKNYLVDFVREKANLERTLQVFEATAIMWPPASVQIEAVAAQALLVQELQMKSSLPVFSYLPKGRKEDRTKIMAQIYFGSGKTFIRGVMDQSRDMLVPDERMVAFRTEYMAFPRGTHDDTLDAAESALSGSSDSGVAASISVDAAETVDDWQKMRNRQWGIL